MASPSPSSITVSMASLSHSPDTCDNTTALSPDYACSDGTDGTTSMMALDSIPGNRPRRLCCMKGKDCMRHTCRQACTSLARRMECATARARARARAALYYNSTVVPYYS